MSKICPETNETVLYLDCLECETKSCRKQKNTEKEPILEEKENKVKKER